MEGQSHFQKLLKPSGEAASSIYNVNHVRDGGSEKGERFKLGLKSVYHKVESFYLSFQKF